MNTTVWVQEETDLTAMTPQDDSLYVARKLMPQCMDAARRAAWAGARAGVITIEQGLGGYRIAFMPIQGVQAWPEALARQASEWSLETLLAYPELGIVIAVIADDGTSLYQMVPRDEVAGGPIQ